MMIDAFLHLGTETEATKSCGWNNKTEKWPEEEKIYW